MANLPGFFILIIIQIKQHEIFCLHQEAPASRCLPASEDLYYFKLLALPNQGERAFSIVTV
ncbi:MAG: hypothetical protein A2Z16_15855 [Chloroflexi bacterium RBG_16_54_18]|nr:MAG: hypothetical protein A2Z16_15855 [Chloroflexi bacterium RBG_16_54_18]